MVATRATDISRGPQLQQPRPRHQHKLFMSTCPSLQYHLQYRLFPQGVIHPALLSLPSLHHGLHLSHLSITYLLIVVTPAAGGCLGVFLPVTSGLRPGAAKFKCS